MEASPAPRDGLRTSPGRLAAGAASRRQAEQLRARGLGRLRAPMAAPRRSELRDLWRGLGAEWIGRDGEAGKVQVARALKKLRLLGLCPQGGRAADRAASRAVSLCAGRRQARSEPQPTSRAGVGLVDPNQPRRDTCKVCNGRLPARKSRYCSRFCRARWARWQRRGRSPYLSFLQQVVAPLGQPRASGSSPGEGTAAGGARAGLRGPGCHPGRTLSNERSSQAEPQWTRRVRERGNEALPRLTTLSKRNCHYAVTTSKNRPACSCGVRVRGRDFSPSHAGKCLN